jgi:hypothetical protein
MTEAEHKSRTELRSNAEKTLASLEDIAGGTAGEDVQKLVQELRIHQIELEMQNAQLAARQRSRSHAKSIPISTILHLSVISLLIKTG